MGDEGLPAAGFRAGSQIAGYRLEEQIGRGGMAVVFRAQDERLRRQVALKILSPALAADESFRHRFIRESRSAAAVDDPHIIPVYEAGDADGVLFIAMRYVPGGDARTLVSRTGPLPVARAAAIISAVASALDAAHAAGLVHRDVKPANMLVDARPGRPDHVYLSDFGLTKGAVSSISQTGTGPFLGTPTYCAPEQIQGERVDARTDEYALAGAAFTLLSGEPPFARDVGMAVLYAHLSAPPPRLTALRPGLPPAVDDVVVRALAKRPEDRFPSCGEFADALRTALGLQRYDCDVATPDVASPSPDVASPAEASPAEAPDLGEHQDTLAAWFGVCREMAAHGDHAAAEKGFRDVLAVRQRTLGRDHPDTLATWFAIAEEMAARGDPGAEKGFRHVFAARQRTLGPDHPDTLAARLSLAQEMAASGEHAAAAEVFRQVLETKTRILGADHPDILSVQCSIARQLAAAGDHTGAQDAFCDLLPKLEQALGADHPDTLAVRFSLAQDLAAGGDHAGAQHQCRKVLAGRRRTLGRDHPDTLSAWFSVAQEIAAAGDHIGAENQFRGMLPHLRRQLGPDHPDTLATRFSVAREMAARGDTGGAADEFRAMLPHLRRKLGPDHPDTLAAANWISRASRR